MSSYDRRRITPIGALALVAGIALGAAVLLFVGKQLVLWSSATPTSAAPTATQGAAPTDDPLRSDTPVPVETLPPDATPTIEISPIPAEGLTYKVKENDSIWNLCVLFYGEYTEALGQRIIDANVAAHPAISPDGALYVGWILLIPPGDPDATLVPLPTATPAPTIELSPIPTEGATYKVVSGDTILRITYRFYGAATDTLVQKILDANIAKYPKLSVDHLEIGWILTIPPK
jgi:phage tail protein X